MTLANWITLSRLLAVPVFLIAFLNVAVEAAFWIWVAAASTDALDGWAARRTGGSQLGGFLDPAADKLLLLAAYGCLLTVHAIPSWVLIVVLTRDLTVAFGWILLYVLTGSREVAPRFSGKAATAVQMVFAVLVLAAVAYPDVARALAPLQPGLEAFTVALTLASMLDYLVTGQRRFSQNGPG